MIWPEKGDVLRILIIDDQPTFRRHLRRLLILAGFAVVEAENIAEAVEKVSALQPDLAVVDVMLPGIDGIEGTRRLKALAPNLRVILVSAYRDWADIFRSAAKEAGAEAFCSKDELDLDVVLAWR